MSRCYLSFLTLALKLLLCHLTLLLPLVCFLFGLNFVRSFLLIHAGLLPPLLDWMAILACQDGPFLEEVSLENQLVFLAPSSLQDRLPCYFSKQIPEKDEDFSPETQGCQQDK